MKSELDLQIQSGPCQSCGATNYPLSMGGPAICPLCDCGGPSPEQVRALIEENTHLRTQLKSVEADAAVMRGALEKLLHEKFGGFWKPIQDALATNAGKSLLERLKEAEWLLRESQRIDKEVRWDSDDLKLWATRRDTFLNPKPQ